MKPRTKDHAFRWDPHKARLNLRKHGVSFETAATVFDDPSAFPFYDSLHSDVEDRWIIIGRALDGPLLSVIYKPHESQDGEIIRLISARRSTAREHILYQSRGHMIQENLPTEFDEEDYFDPDEGRDGKFATKGPAVWIPIYLEPAILRYFVVQAAAQRTEARHLIDTILRKEIDRLEAEKPKHAPR
jgi:uncharacterized DUF497 family protein